MRRLIPSTTNRLIFLLLFSMCTPGSTARLLAAPGMGSSVVPAALQVEGREDPVGVDRLQPQFSWRLKAVDLAGRDLAQSAFQIQVSAKPEVAAGEVWDSGRVESAVYYQARFGGEGLQSQTTYFWKVRVWDQAGRVSGWSEARPWTMGVLRAEEWTGHWIGAGPDAAVTPASVAKSKEEHGMTMAEIPPLPVFRKDFPVDKKVARAIVSVSGLGQYELRVNGREVTSTVMNPGWTDYRKTVLYNSYDVTEMLKAGGNSLGVLLGNGMYNVQGVKGRYTKFAGTFGQPKLMLQMKVLYADGTQQTIVSDGSWKTAPGPIVFSSTYGGEDFDAAKEAAGWDLPEFSASAWAAAAEVASPVEGAASAGVGMAAQAMPSMEIAETLSPVKVNATSEKVRVYDLGKNMSGWPAIEVRGHAGDEVRLVAGELLDDKGHVSQRSANAGPDDPVVFRYKLRGGEVERWHPRFSYYGFRYVQAELLPAGGAGGALPELLSVKGQFVHDAVKLDGHFGTSDRLLDRIHGLIDRAVLSNLASVLTDCPTREKLGWLEQTHLNAATLMYNYDVRGLYDKSASDMDQSQLADGLVPSIAPEYVAFTDDDGTSNAFRDSPEWGSAVILATWDAYQFYGDRQLLERHYEAMRRYALYLRTKAKDHILAYGLGDWYDIGPGEPGESKLTGKEVTATATYFQDLVALREIATLLGKTGDAAEYALEASAVKEAFNRRLFHPETHQYDRGSQTANAMPLALGMVPEAEKAAVLANLVADIRGHQNHVTAGDVGFHYMVRALTNEGRSDVLYDMLSRTDSPSYGYQLSRGATTLTEAWDTNPTSSQNHFMLGHAEEWFYRGLAGIDVNMSRAAPRQIVIHPAMLKGVPDAQAAYESVLGRVESSWKHEGARTWLAVTVPAGAKATVELPEGARMDGAGTGKEFVVGSGSYRFWVGR